MLLLHYRLAPRATIAEQAGNKLGDVIWYEEAGNER